MKTLSRLTALMATIVLLSSCGTVLGTISGGKRPVWLMQAPNDIQVKVNGEDVDVKREYLASNESSGGLVSVTTNYFTKGVRVPFKKDVMMELYSPSQNKSAKFTLKSKGAGMFFWGNLFLWPVVGHVIDGVSKNNHLLKPRYIDVEYALDGKDINERRRKNKLMRKEKRSIRKG